MVSIARRLHLDNEPLMCHAIVQSLRPEIRLDVRVLRPSTLEDLAEAAAIGESNARLAATGPQQPTDTAISAQLAEMRSMVAVLTEIVSTQQRPGASADTADAPTPRRAQPATTATMAVHVQQDVVTIATAPMASATEPRGMTVQLVMPPANTAHYGSNRETSSGRPARKRGCGYRGTGRGPGHSPPLNAAAAPFRDHGGTYNTTSLGADATPACAGCGRRPADNECAARDAICYCCGISGHFACCCHYRLNAQHHP